jgi:alanine racemase
MSEMSWIEVDLGAIEHNVRALRGLTGEGPHARAVCAVVKKDAYGLGAVAVSHRLMRCGVEMLAVYSPDEAAELVAKAVTLPMLLLSPLRELNRTDVLYRHTVAEKLHVSIHDPEQLKAVNTIGHTFGIRMPIQPYVDTGMSRSGLSVEQFVAMMRELDKTPFVRITGVFTHMATGDDNPDFAAEQFERFEAALEPFGADGIQPALSQQQGNEYR